MYFQLPGPPVAFVSYSVQCEQVDQQQNEWAAEAAAARWTREINWEIDTDKSHTLRLPGRQLSAEQAAGSISYKRLWAFFFFFNSLLVAGKSSNDKKARCAWRRLI